MNHSISKGYTQVPGGDIWYKIVGHLDSAKIPLVILHGGPGCPHDYLEPLEQLADDRPVILYDQLGCGKSDRPTDQALWRTERFVEELEHLRRALNIEKMHLLGHSWGSMLATDYALRYSNRLTSLIHASPPLSIPRWLADLSQYRTQLPLPIQEVLNQHEAAGTTASEEYTTATMEFYRRHICRLNPWPEPMMRMQAGFGHDVYTTMWGANEFFMTGNLRTYDQTHRLSEIKVPSLFTCGQFDEATPSATAWYKSLSPHSELAIFKHSAHMPHLEESEAYLRVVRQFLKRVDRTSAPFWTTHIWNALHHLKRKLRAHPRLS